MVQRLPGGCPGDDGRGWISCFVGLGWNGEGFGIAVGRTAGWSSAGPSVRASRGVTSLVPATGLVASSLG